MKELATRILDARVSFRPQRFRVPLKLSTGSVSETTEAEAEVTVRVNGRLAAQNSQKRP